MLLNIIRAIFVLAVGGLGVRLAQATEGSINWALLFGGVLVAAILVLVVDIFTPRKRIQTISAVYFGLIVGLILSNLVQSAIEPTLTVFLPSPATQRAVHGLMTVLICYACVSTLLQTKDDLRFIIPYMEFSKEVKGTRPLVLDTSVVIDGRIADVAETRVIDQPLIVPRFVLQELQGIADSSDKLRRNRGRRGLDILNKLQKMTDVQVKIHDAEIPELAGIR